MSEALFYDSPAYGEWCKRVFGRNLNQLGNVTIDELDLLCREVAIAPKSNVLDMGCGSGDIASYVAERLDSHVTGIDIADILISYADITFQNNASLSFQCKDFNDMAFDADSFDLIYFCDTLCFSNSVASLRALLNKCLLALKQGGKLAVFWTNHPSKQEIYEMSEPNANNTQIGIWGKDRDVHVKAIELTDGTRQFWLKSLAEFQSLKSELESEIPEFYKMRMRECEFFADLCSKGDDGGVYRWLYIFTKK